MLLLIQLFKTNYIKTNSVFVKPVIHTCIRILIITHFTGGCACETYCTLGQPVPVGTFIYSGVILLACSVYITLQVYHLLLLLPLLLLLLCPLRIKAISKMVGISVAILQYKLHSETNIILKNGSYRAETQQSLYLKDRTFRFVDLLQLLRNLACVT